MADVIGPNSYLPGRRLKPLLGVMCDEHPTVLSVTRVVGETDSYGSEINDLCQECVDLMDEQIKETSSGNCDWCKNHSPELVKHRDYEEGSTGPVYDVCAACISKENDCIAENYASDLNQDSSSDLDDDQDNEILDFDDSDIRQDDD